MKKIYTLFLMLAVVSCGYGQSFYNQIDFESGISDFDYITINKVSDTNNIWQIGVPGKAIFDSAYSVAHAIVTDTLNPYPVNDTSFFIITHLRPLNAGGNASLQLNFRFKFNSDTLTDFGKVETSIDQGKTWINLMTDDITYQFSWLEPKPELTGNSNGWQYFSLELRTLTYELGFSDTLLYRFTFISDSVQTNKEGWMIDDFVFADEWEGIEEHFSNEIISIIPNPASGIIKLDFIDIGKNNHMQILNNSGVVVFETTNYKENLLDMSQLKNGIYFLHYFCEDKTLFGKFIICH